MKLSELKQIIRECIYELDEAKRIPVSGEDTETKLSRDGWPHMEGGVRRMVNRGKTQQAHKEAMKRVAKRRKELVKQRKTNEAYNESPEFGKIAFPKRKEILKPRKPKIRQPSGQPDSLAKGWWRSKPKSGKAPK